MRLYQKCKLLLLLQDYTDITNATCKLLLLLQDCTKNAYYKLMLLLQDYTDTTNAYYKLLLLLQDYTKNAYCKLLLLQSVAVSAKRCQICIRKLLLKLKKYFELQCHLNSIYPLLSARPFDKRTETASVLQYFQFLRYKILLLI